VEALQVGTLGNNRHIAGDVEGARGLLRKSCLGTCDVFCSHRFTLKAHGIWVAIADGRSQSGFLAIKQSVSIAQS
jgi:hypothetical protein